MHPTNEVIGEVLRQAIEGGGLVGWARVDEWDGVSRARITEVGGTAHVLDEAVARRGAMVILTDDAYAGHDEFDVLTAQGPEGVDGDLADSVIQLGLFGRVVYR